MTQKYSTTQAAACLFDHLVPDWTTSLREAKRLASPYYLWHGPGFGGKDDGSTFWIPNLIDSEFVKNHVTDLESSQLYHTGLGIPSIGLLCCSFVEIDHLPQEEQEAAYRQLSEETGLNWALWVHSGNKSVHAYLSFAEGLEPGDPIWEQIQVHLIVLLGGDAKITDSSRLLRLPGSTRRGRHQTILHLDEKSKYPAEEILSRLQACAQARGVDVPKALAALKFLQAAQGKKRNQTPERREEATRLAQKWLREGAWAQGLSDEKVKTLSALTGKKLKTLPTSKGSTQADKEYLPGDTIVEAVDGAAHTFTEWHDPESSEAELVRVFCPACPAGKASAAAIYPKYPSLKCHRCGVTYRPLAAPLEVEDEDLDSLFGESKYLEIDWTSTTDPVVILAADTGTGKTTCLQALVEKYKNQNKKILCIVHRQALALALAPVLGLDNYLELPDGEIESDHVVVCINSLGRIPTHKGDTEDLLEFGVQGFDLLLIEESESVFDQLTGDLIPVVQSKKGGIWDSGGIHAHLSTLVRTTVANGGQVVAADGFAAGPFSLTEKCLGYLGLTQIPKIFSKKSDQSHVTLTEHPTGGGAIARIIQLAQEGKRVAVACTKAEWVRLLGLHFQSSGIHTLCIHSDSDEFEFETLGDVETSWAIPQILVYSPSVDTGVSFDPRDKSKKFDHLFVLGARIPNLGVTKIHQMRHRLREMDSIHWWIPENYSNDFDYDLDNLKTAQLIRWERACKTAIKYHQVEPGKIKPVLDEGHFAHAALAQSSRIRRWAQVRQDWIAWWEARGAQFETHPQLSQESEKAVRDLLRELRVLDSETYTKEVLGAEVLDGETYRAKRKSPSREKNLRRSLEKGRHYETYGSLCEELVPKDRFRRVYAKVRQATSNLLVALGRDDAASEYDTRTVESGKRAHARTYHSASKVQYTCLKEALGSDLTQSLFGALREGITAENHSANSEGPHLTTRGESLSILGSGPNSPPPLLIEWRADLLNQKNIFKKFIQPGVWEKLSPLLQGSGLSKRSFEVPTKLVGEILKGMALAPKVKRKKEKDGTRYRVYTIDQEVVDEAVALIRRCARKKLGLSVIDYDVLTGRVSLPTLEENLSLDQLVDDILG